MKRILITLAAVLCLTVSASAQNGLGSILGSLTGSGSNSGGNLITSITAITFKSSTNALSNLAGSAATTAIEKKLDQYLSKVGISKGLFGFTFNEDGTMSVNYGSRTFNGTWTLDADKSVINMKVKSLVNMKGYVAVQGNQMELQFDTTTMMKLIKSVCSVYNKGTLQTINSLLNQYDEMYSGFKLVK